MRRKNADGPAIVRLSFEESCDRDGIVGLNTSGLIFAIAAIVASAEYNTEYPIYYQLLLFRRLSIRV